MSEAAEIAHWIGHLADPDPTERSAAATRLRVEAYSLCLPAIQEWIRDAEFRGLVRHLAEDGRSQPSPEWTPIVVGIAVRPENFERIRAANGSPKLADVPPDQDAREFELRFGGHSDLDILTTRAPSGEGAIARYLQKFGEGIQQIELNVTDVDRATEILRSRFELTPIYPATRAGADGTRVNFFLVPATGGRKVLIELVEPAAKS